MTMFTSTATCQYFQSSHGMENQVGEENYLLTISIFQHFIVNLTTSRIMYILNCKSKSLKD